MNHWSLLDTWDKTGELRQSHVSAYFGAVIFADNIIVPEGAEFRLVCLTGAYSQRQHVIVSEKQNDQVPILDNFLVLSKAHAFEVLFTSLTLQEKKIQIIV